MSDSQKRKRKIKPTNYKVSGKRQSIRKLKANRVYCRVSGKTYQKLSDKFHVPVTYSVDKNKWTGNGKAVKLNPNELVQIVLNLCSHQPRKKRKRVCVSKILRIAHFEICDCGQHGHIVFSDKSKGNEVWSESEALAQLEQAAKDGKLLSVEVLILKKQILDFRLPSADFPTIMDVMYELAHQPTREEHSRYFTLVSKVCPN